MSIKKTDEDPFVFNGDLDPVESFFYLIKSFNVFESYGTTGENIDKSTNAHNCRKSALLS